MAWVNQTDKTVVVRKPNKHIVFSAGRQGPPGVDGASGSSFEHAQSVAASIWTVNHNLGFRPNVSVKTLGGLEVDAEVLHVSVNQVQVIFDSPSTGIANFS
jgi:hypothetical protein